MSDYFKSRMSEASTLRGLILFLGGLLGLDFSDGDVATILAFTQLAAGVVGMLSPDTLGAEK